MNRTVETILIIGLFAVLALLATSWIGTAVLGASANRATCVVSYDVDDVSGSVEACETDTYNIEDTVANAINEQRGSRF